MPTPTPTPTPIPISARVFVPIPMPMAMAMLCHVQWTLKWLEIGLDPIGLDGILGGNAVSKRKGGLGYRCWSCQRGNSAVAVAPPPPPECAIVNETEKQEIAERKSFHHFFTHNKVTKL